MNNYDREFGDDLCSNDKRLKYKWKWQRVASQISENELKKWTHFQCSRARVNEEWDLIAIQWSSGEDVTYEANIGYIGEDIADIEGFKTRLDAQIGAEKLLKNWIKNQTLLIK